MSNSLAEIVHESMASSLLGYIKTLLRDCNTAEDIFQNVFCKLWQTKTSIENIKNLKAFVFAIARNEVWRELDKRKSRIRIVQDDSAFFEVAKPEQISILDSLSLEEALLRIPEEQREIVYLKIYGLLTFQEIADILKISINTATSRYRYGLEKMNKFLRENNE
ncbi:RNA polymerase sigma factor [Candidatus Uabimicrobium sp. HlEnr_7]|uniref:RNA polymerase sigma factor n=1 Tax=Candidatus Uabimicrobium helgolandensis TaxID=3095367 RepID=UPI0035562741